MSGLIPRPPRSVTGSGVVRPSTTGPRTAGRVLALFCLSVTDAGLVAEIVEHEPVHLIMAMTPDLNLRMKPQNLLTGLPIKHPEAVS
jgi:hypothetical protein